MKYKIAVIGDEDTILGFRLAGVKAAYSIDGSQQCIELIKKLVKNGDVGIIFVSERLIKDVRKEVDELLEDKTFPIVVEIPDKFGMIEKEDVLDVLIRRAIGIKLG